MKDCKNNEIRIGDNVAMIYHPKSYVFFVKKGRIIEMYGPNKKELKVILDDEPHKIQGFLPDETKERYPKLIKIDSNELFEECEGAKDAIGQSIHVGDHIYCAQNIVLGNSLKGFEEGGIVTKITKEFAFFLKDGRETKKKLKWVVVS